MRKGTKRKDASNKHEEETEIASSSSSTSRAKPKPKPEPNTSSPRPHRNMEDLWKSVFPAGTEWEQMDTLYQTNWDFSNLEDAFEEGGKLYGEKVYLFGCTEAKCSLHNGKTTVICIPVIVAVVSPEPPSNEIGITSVQSEAEEIVPMKKMKMDWVPYIPLEDRDCQVERLKPKIYILRCTQRRPALKHLKLDRLKKYEYCLPYFKNPLKEDELEQSTELQIIFPAEPNPVYCQYDWGFDEYDEFTDEMIKEGALDEDQKDAFKEYVKNQVREAKKKQREEREARKKAIEEMSPNHKAALENMRFYKFYPSQTPDVPDISDVKEQRFINRYYGKAHETL